MSKITVYHNPRCSKSRCALSYLEEKNQEFEVIEYLKTPPTRKLLNELISQLGISAETLVRKGEPEYQTHFRGKKLSGKEWIDAMIEYPKLIERPIVVKDGKAVIARPTEEIDKLI